LASVTLARVIYSSAVSSRELHPTIHLPFRKPSRNHPIVRGRKTPFFPEAEHLIQLPLSISKTSKMSEEDDEKLVTKPFKFVTGRCHSLRQDIGTC